MATGATANDTDVNLKARANHTGTQSADTITDGTANKAFLTAERTKLTGIATGATANDTDANLRARAGHTGTQAQVTVDGLVQDLGIRAQRFAVPRIADAIVMQVTAQGVVVEVETPFVKKGQVQRPQLYTVPRIGRAQRAEVGAGGVVLATSGDFGEPVTAFATGDQTAGTGQIEQRHASGARTGRVVPQAFLRRSEGKFVALTGGETPARLLSADLAAGAATVRRNGVVHALRWRTTALGLGGVMHMALVFCQSNGLGHLDDGNTDKRPFWRDPVAENAWQFRAGDLVDRGPRVLQVSPVGANKAVALAGTQIAALERLAGSRHAENPTYGQTSVESLALALLGQHLHPDDHVLGCVIGTGSTASADFAVGSVHYQNAQAAITAGLAQATARGLALRLWIVPNQGEEDNSIGTLQATYVATWRAILAGLAAHVVAGGGAYGGAVIQQTLQRPSGVTGMATLAQAELVAAGLALAVVPQACQPGFFGSTHYANGTQAPLGAATAHEIARAIAAPAAISGFVAAASKGARFAPAHLGNLWQADTQVTPVTGVGQTVGRIDGTGPGGAVAFSQATAGSRPALAAGGLVAYDGASDFLDGDATLLALTRNVGAVTFLGRVRIGNLTATQTIFGFSAVGSANRLSLRVLTTGALSLNYRRLDADSLLSYSTAVAVVAATTSYSVMLVVNASAGTAQLYLNGGSDILAATLASAGLTQDTASLRARIGVSVATTPVEYFTGSLGRFAFTNTVPTTEERAAIFAELALDPRSAMAPHVAPGDAVWVTGTQIDAKISGGSGTFVFDTVTMPADTAGTYGVRVENDAGAVAISAVTIVTGNTLRITLAASVSLPTNPRVEFGLFGPASLAGAAASRVNIRDNSAWPCPCTGQIISGWVMHHRAIVT